MIGKKKGKVRKEKQSRSFTNGGEEYRGRGRKEQRPEIRARPENLKVFQHQWE